MAREDARSKKEEMIRNNRKINHWLNWDQLLSKESGGVIPASAAALEGAKNHALWAMDRKMCRHVGSYETG